MNHRQLTTRDLQGLVEQARASDPDAWEALYRHLYPRLHSYARRRLADDAQADDAVSEAMTRAIDGIDNFIWRGVGFDGWMYGILRNVVLERYRHHSRNPVVDPDAAPEPSTDPRHDPAALAIAGEDARQLRAAFARLSESDQEVLELRIVGGLDAESVGAIVGRGAGAVRMAQSRALDRLRAHVKELSS